MKYQINSIVLCIALLFILNSCNKEILEIDNPNAFDPVETWNDQALSNAYLTNLYTSVMPNGWPARSGALFGGISTDDQLGIINENTIQITSHPWSGSFTNQYEDIRKINILVKEIGQGSLEESTKNTILGQALFLRAYSYFLLVRVYGGIPLILEPQELTDEIFVSRASSREVFTAILADLDRAISLLDGQVFAEGDSGRIGQGAALALKGRVALYMASPLFHPNNPYSNSDWQTALTATKAAKDQLSSMGFGLNDDYSGIWAISNEGNSEAVLTVKFTAPDKIDGRREAGARPSSQTSNDRGQDQPVWSLVSAYPMKDGHSPGSSLSAYSYDEQSFWLNRDPRFDQTIVYNGSTFELSGIKGRKQYTDGEVGEVSDAFTSKDGYLSSDKTGFFTRKGIQTELPTAEVGQNEVDWIEIRYAEVLLNYAEAANETGDQDAALEVLQQIRKRAGIEAGSDGSYGITAQSKEEVREAILLERFIEFPFEGQRFWDLKRSRNLQGLENVTDQGVEAFLIEETVDIDKQRNSLYLSEDFTYEVKPIIGASNVNFVIPDNYYFAPIPIEQIQRNDKLAQTSGWGDGSFDPTLE